MRGELLLDTGALVSLLDRSQTHHLKCRRAFADWTGPVVSTEAVLTEATHLLAGVQGGRAACVDFFLSGGALLVPSSTPSLQRVRKLLDKYADLPMDFADATLVLLGDEITGELDSSTAARVVADQDGAEPGPDTARGQGRYPLGEFGADLSGEGLAVEHLCGHVGPLSGRSAGRR